MTDKQLPAVAVLGTGIMGAGMARSLARAGLAVRVWNRTPEEAAPLAEVGAVVADSPAEAVRGADVVITMVFDADAAIEALEAAAEGLTPGSLWVQSTTVGLNDVPRLASIAERLKVILVDAPVLGTKKPAEDGELVVLAAAPLTVRDRLAPVFDAIGSRSIWAGDEPGAGTGLKLVANSWVLAVTNATGETVSLATALGVDPNAFLDAICGGGLDLPYLRMKAAAIIDDRLTPPSFAAKTAVKDARLIVAAGAANGARLDGLAAAAARFDRVIEDGHGEEDMATVFRASFR